MVIERRTRAVMRRKVTNAARDFACRTVRFGDHARSRLTLDARKPVSHSHSYGTSTMSVRVNTTVPAGPSKIATPGSLNVTVPGV